VATQDKESTNTQHKENNTVKTIGAVGGIIALLALLFIGVSQTKSAGAELITDGSKPDKAKYEADASGLDYEKAILKDYETGKLLEFKGKVHKKFEKAQKGETTILLDIIDESENAPATTETNQVILTFLEEPKQTEEYAVAQVLGRYIGTLEYETSVGTMKEVPAIQVDYFFIEK